MTPYPVPKDFHVPVSDLRVVASGLNRPECVLALDDGTLLTSHGAGGYSVIDSSGQVSHTLPAIPATRQHVPNGIALAPSGKVIFADLGAQMGGLFSLSSSGNIEPVLTEVQGQALPPTNFLMVDELGVLWFTVSTTRVPRSLAWNHEVSDGFIGVMDADGARIVADGLGYTNELAFSPNRRWLYVNETYAQRVSRFAVGGTTARPQLGVRETVVQLGGADLPDGLAFDIYGGLWVACIASNRVLLVRPDGEVQTVISDTDPAHAERIAHGVAHACLQHVDMQTYGNSRLGNVSSIAFGGARMSTAFLGCLLDDKIRAFQSPVPGLPLPHARRRVATVRQPTLP